MALVIEVYVTSSWVDITANLALLGDPNQGLQPFEMEQVRESNISIMRFSADSGAADQPCGREIRVVVDGDQWFGGYITTREQMRFGAAGWVYGANYECQDYNVLLDRVIVPGYTIDAGDTDSTEIETLRSTYLNGAGVTAGDIQTVQASMPAELELKGTFRQCMEQIAAAAGGAVFFIDVDKTLNYAAAGGDFTWASTNNLSDDLSIANSFAYGDFVERSDESRRVTDVYIVGDGIEGWYPSPASGFYYQMLVTDPTITTQAGLDALGAAIVDDFGSALVEYRLKCWEDSFWTYGEVRVRHSDFITAGGEVLFVRRSVCRALSSEGDEREIILELGDHTTESNNLGPAPSTGAGGMSQHNLLYDPFHADAADHPVARGDLIVGNSTPAWDGLAHPASANRYVQANADDPGWVANITLDDDAYVGLGAAAGRFVFDSTPATDELRVTTANLDLNGNDLIIDTDGDSYLHESADDVVDLVLAGATGELGIHINGAEDFTFTANSFNVPTGSYITMADDTWIGLGIAAGRLEFEASTTPDTIWVDNAVFDMNGNDFIIDTDGDSYLHASADDVVDLVLATASGEFAIHINGAQDFQFVANSFVAETGSSIDVNGNNLILDADGDTYFGMVADDQVGLYVATNLQYTFTSTHLALRDTADTTRLWLRVHGDVTSTAADIYANAQLGLAADDNVYVFIDANNGGTNGYFAIAKNDDTTSGASEIMRVTESPKMFLNETAESDITIGLCINQGANDDYIMTFKSSDVAHAITNYAETDTYGTLSKSAGAAGGLQVRGFRDSGGSAWKALNLEGILGEAADTGKTSSGHGVVAINAAIKSGAGIAALGANGNIVSFENNGSTRALIDEDGDFYYDGSLNNFDAENDALAVRDLQRGLTGRWAETLAYNRERLQEMGILGTGDGTPLLSTKGVTALMAGAIGQLYERCQQYERAFAALGIDPAPLEGGQ